jgi:hypothetical protein
MKAPPGVPDELVIRLPVGCGISETFQVSATLIYQ